MFRDLTGAVVDEYRKVKRGTSDFRSGAKRNIFIYNGRQYETAKRNFEKWDTVTN